MKTVIIYQCEYCEKTFPDKSSAMDCEATHFGLKPEEYAAWKRLNKKAVTAGKTVGIQKNPETDKIFYDAVRALTEFEIEHNIKADSRKPTDFYY